VPTFGKDVESARRLLGVPQVMMIFQDAMWEIILETIGFLGWKNLYVGRFA
jgi:hypothetical protein